MAIREWGVEVCFEAIRARGNRGVALLVGAGCSRTAEIKTAAGFVEEIRKCYPERCRDLPVEKAYEHATNRLSDDEWRRLFGKTVRDAKLNVAHLCIAELVDRGVVDRVLTTNFDSLLLQACALGEKIPLIHDCATTDELDDWVDEEGEAIFYLHGQEHGRKMLNPGKLNTPNSEAPTESSDKDKPLLEKLLKTRAELVSKIVMGTIRRRPLIVCGHSGMSDKVFRDLQAADDLNNPVFWIAHSGDDAARVRSQFSKEALSHRIYVIHKPGGDEFFYELLLALGMNPPLLLEQGIPRTSLDSGRIGWPAEDWEQWKEARARCLRVGPPDPLAHEADTGSGLPMPKEASPTWEESFS